ILSRHVSEEDLSNAGGVADRSRCLARRIQSAAAPSGALVLWQNPDADIRGQCAVGEGENLSGVTLVRTRCLSGEVLSYTTNACTVKGALPSEQLFTKTYARPFAA